MALTPEQIKAARQRLGLPDTRVEDTPAYKVAQRRNAAARFDAQQKAKQGYLSRVGEHYMSGAKDVMSGLDEAVGQMESGQNIRGAKTAALRTTGAVARATFAPILEAPGVRQIIDSASEKLAGNPGVQWLGERIKEFHETNPELAKDLRDVIDIASLGVGTFGEKTIQEGVEGGARETLERVIPKSLKNIKTGVVETAEGVGRNAGKIGGYAESRVPKLLGIFSGENDDVISQALKNPKAADIGIEQGDVALRQAVEEGATNSVKLRQAYIQGFSQAKQDVMGEYTKTLIPKNNVVGTFNKLLKENDVVVNKDGTLDFTVSKIKANPGEISKINDAYAALKKWDKFSIDSLDEYKQLVGKLTRFSSEGNVPSKSPFLGRLYNELNDIAYERLPKDVADKYRGLNKQFSENIELYDDMVDVFNSGDPFTKLANSLSKNKDTIRQVLDFYEQKSGKSVLPIVAGRELAMEKTAAFGFLNPRSWVDFFISPKLQGKIILRAGERLKPKQ